MPASAPMAPPIFFIMPARTTCGSSAALTMLIAPLPRQRQRAAIAVCFHVIGISPVMPDGDPYLYKSIMNLTIKPNEVTNA
jgi:hypothetical protein